MAHRAKRQRFLQYSDALELVRRHSIHSRAHYWRWHDSVKPPLPRMPNKHYAEWSSWNDFLGTMNSFEKTLRKRMGMKVSWRPFWEAVRYAQRVAKEEGIHTQKEWEKWHDSGMCPKDIPKRPQLEYSEFTGVGWKTWLGKNIRGKIMSQKQNLALFALHTTTTMPKNILTIRKYTDGMYAMQEAMRDDPSLEKPLRVYKWEDPLADQVYKVVEALGVDKGNNQWLCPNVHELIFELDNMLEWHR